MRIVIATLGVLLNTSSHCFAMQVTQLNMPTADVLRTRLQAYKQLIDNTDLIEDIAGKNIYDCNVVIALDLALYDYRELLKKTEPNRSKAQAYHRRLEASRPELLMILLQDFPVILQALSKTGAFKPTIFN